MTLYATYTRHDDMTVQQMAIERAIQSRLSLLAPTPTITPTSIIIPEIMMSEVGFTHSKSNADLWQWRQKQQLDEEVDGGKDPSSSGSSSNGTSSNIATSSSGSSSGVNNNSCSTATSKAQAPAPAPVTKRPCSTSMNWIRDVLVSDSDSGVVVDGGQCQGKSQSQGQSQGQVKDKSNNSNNSNSSSNNSSSNNNSSNNNSKGQSNSSLIHIDQIESVHKRVKTCCGGTLEITIADTGALQGAVKSAIGKVEASSRLCRRKAAQLFGDLVLLQFHAARVLPTEELHFFSSHSIHCHNPVDSTSNVPTQPNVLTQPSVLTQSSGLTQSSALTQPSILTQSYSAWKLQSRSYQERKRQFLASTSPFSLWIVDDPLTKVIYNPDLSQS